MATRRRTRSQSRPSPEAKPAPAHLADQGDLPGGKSKPPRTDLPGGAPPPHRDPVPLWLIITIFLVLEVIVILANYGKWQYRTVIAHARQAMAEQRWDDALKYWAQHARNYPSAVNSTPFRTDRARCRLGAGDYKGALEDLDFIKSKLEERNQSLDANLLSEFAQCQAHLGQTDQAFTTYEKVLKLDPNNTEANLFIGRQLLDKGQILKAATMFQSVPVEKYPEDLKKRWKVIEDQLIRKAEEQAAREDQLTTAPIAKPEATPVSASEKPTSPTSTFNIVPTAAPAATTSTPAAP